ncbi:MAG: sigma 54-interacting transcriptional regulator [Pelovirga sp.]
MLPSPDLLEAIFKHMNEGVIFLDNRHVIRICNPAAEKIRKVTASQIIGRSIFDIHPRRAHPQISELLANLQSSHLPFSHRVIQAQGRYFDNSYSSIRDVQGDFLGTLLVSRDITEQRRLADEVSQLKDVLAAREKEPPLIVDSPVMRRVLESLEAVAPLESTVLISGESGTGKECFVDLIHKLSQRRDGPLVKVNCGAIPENLVESQLFGHVKGAFTGAHADHKGKFMAADGGTLFLDEIGELPLAAQVKLLRVIQDRLVQPVGGHQELKVDARIVVATNIDLGQAVANGRFREDLFYRLNVIALEIPPLRQRPEDVIPLAEAFLKFFARKMKKPLPVLSAAVRELLLGHPLPGNVRQLKHAMERAVALGRGDKILPGDLPADFVTLAKGSTPPLSFGQGPLKEIMARCEREIILQALNSNAGKRIPTAKALGITRKTLWEKMQRHQIDSDVTETEHFS